MTRRGFVLGAAATATDALRGHVRFFENVWKDHPADSVEWMERNIPRFTCSDAAVERLYYYRWWTLHQHIHSTPDGRFIGEFLKPVKHAGPYNALSCALGHHVAEARWLHDRSIAQDDLRFWLRSGPNGGLHPNLHQFSGWTAAAVWDSYLATGEREAAVALLDSLLLDYRTWENERLLPSGLFWQRDVADGMEESVSGGRRVRNVRPSINSYMFGNAQAIERIATLAGKPETAREYASKAARLRDLVLAKLWNPEQQFFETVLENGAFAGVREQIGFTPWYFGLPESGRGYEAAWAQLTDPAGFAAPFGPTTAERRHPGFRISYEGDDCQWNGPSWPFATTITLRGLAEACNGPAGSAQLRDTWWSTFQTYVRSQKLKLDDGREVPFIDEDLNPLTGEWLARAAKIRKGTYYARGDHYNHSGFADLLITGAVGLRPRVDGTLEVSPLARASEWTWFRLENLPYRGHILSIVWNAKDGLQVSGGGRAIASQRMLTRLTAKLD